MPTLFLVGRYRVVTYFNDHEPAHVHAVGPDGYAKFALGEKRGEVALMEAEGIPRGSLHRIAAAIIDRHSECRKLWNSIHGDQVGNRKGR